MIISTVRRSHTPHDGTLIINLSLVCDLVAGAHLIKPGSGGRSQLSCGCEPGRGAYSTGMRRAAGGRGEVGAGGH